MSEYLDCIASSAPSKFVLVISETSSIFTLPGRPLCDLLSDMRSIYGSDFEYKLVTYERNDLK